MGNITKWLGLVAAIVLIGLVNGIASAQGSPGFGIVTGTVGYLPRIALPESAEVVVELIDVTDASVPPKVLASQVIIANGRQVPFEFSLSYHAGSIVEGGAYAVSAKIYVDGGRLQWATDTPQPVITNGLSMADVTLVQAAATILGGEGPDVAAAFGTVTGSASYLQRIALPPNAVVQVELEDVSRADAPAFVLSSQQFVTSGRQVPFRFALKYDVASIDERGRYSVRARIYEDGALRWITDTFAPVITNGVLDVDVRLIQVVQ